MSMSHAQADGVEYSSQARLTYSEMGPKLRWLEFLISETEVGQLLKSVNSLGGFAELSGNDAHKAQHLHKMRCNEAN